jgi:hypothetical protein
MEEKVNLFITLVKLKFYLVSLLDSPMEKNSFYFTEEFLERRIPELKDDLFMFFVSSLLQPGIKYYLKLICTRVNFYKFKICWRITNCMLIIFRIVTTVKSKCSPAEIAMYILNLISTLPFSQKYC